VNTQKPKVFVSYHHDNDQGYREEFESLFAENYGVNNYGIMISKSVQIGDINPMLSTESIRNKIRDEYLRDSSVTVVLIGTQTWQRKHVDWEIGASIRDTKYNHRSGLLGILLPTYHFVSMGNFNPYTIPPRLYYNFKCKFAKIYMWNTNPYTVQSWIHSAFLDKDKILPDNSYPSFSNNRTGDRWYE